MPLLILGLIFIGCIGGYIYMQMKPKREDYMPKADDKDPTKVIHLPNDMEAAKRAAKESKGNDDSDE